jgi:hypothetical protein
MADNVGRAGRYSAIAGAFAGQAWIFLTIGMLFVGWALAPKATSISVAQPATASLLPVVSPEPTAQLSPMPYALAINGLTVRGVFFQGRLPLEAYPAYTIVPDRDLVVRLTVTVPATVHLTDVTLSLAQDTHAAVQAQFKVVFHDHAHPLAPGQHTFTARWTGSIANCAQAPSGCCT